MNPDGGSAFPRYEPSGGDRYSGPLPEVRYAGMSLRDWFAGQFLSTIQIHGTEGVDGAAIASNCYRMADAMLNARVK